MNDLWYRHLGFKQNPLSIKPAALHDEVIAYDLEDIYDKVEFGEVIFIEGPYGMGKSTILKNIVNEFGADSVGVLTSAKCLNEENYLMNKLARQVIGTNNIDHCARL